LDIYTGHIERAKIFIGTMYTLDCQRTLTSQNQQQRLTDK